MGIYPTSQMMNLSYTKVKILIFIGFYSVILKLKHININYKYTKLL